ncbi:hypothetical protein [Candidatus Avelusimicrobium alvi]|uniref:hypothetical protein n=1 Tax=Candidatus Avelusimicrobium alvi TaxID=3416221 RepID=UPI003D121427
MKRVLTVLVLLSGACVLHAEQMTFVTTLSSPLGTFAQLETADYSATTSVPLLNFCNTRSSAGTVALKGADTYLQTLSLKNGTTLGGNTPEYRISGTLSVNNNSEVTGGRLLANTASLSGASSAKSKVEDTLYAASLKVKGAKTPALTIPGQVQTSGTGDGEAMHWSNIYTKDYKCANGTCSETGGAYTSYLLKSIESSCKNDASVCLQQGKIYKDATCICESCPSGQTTSNGLTCGSNWVPKIEDWTAFSYCRSYISQELCQDPGLIEQNYPPCIHDTYPSKATTFRYGKNPVETPSKRGPINACRQESSGMRQFISQFVTPPMYSPQQSLADCPSGTSDAKLCKNNCSSSSNTCSYTCLKSKNVSEACGTGYTSSYCDYMGCKQMNMACMGRVNERHTEFGPQLGTAKVLVCVQG